MSNTQQIREYIRACEHMMKFFNSMLSKGDYSPNDEDKLKELTELRFQIRKDDWPKAIDDKESDPSHDFLGSLSIPIKNQSVLEFGGCDYNLGVSLKKDYDAEKVVSYDIELCRYKKTMLHNSSVVYTDNFKLVQQKGNYNIILVNDIIDHVENSNYWLHHLCDLIDKDTGRIFIRCHPYTSKNGTHIGEQTNKAFLHLIFNDNELATLGVTNKFTRKTIDSTKSYRKLFEECGLKIVKEVIKKEVVESMFLTDSRITERIKNSLGIQENLIDFLEIKYIDYELMR